MNKALKWALIGLMGANGGIWLEPAFAEVLKDIQIEGLEHLSRATVLAALPIKVGSTVADSSTDKVIKALYDTGLFREVEAEIQDGTLLIALKESQTIGSIDVVGNRDIKRKVIDDIMRQMKIIAGHPVDQNRLYQFKQILLTRYHDMGMQNAKVDITTTDEGRGRVKVALNIDEGVTIKIRKLNIVGNRAVSSRTIKSQLASKDSGLFSWWLDDDVYSKEKIAQDIEIIKKIYRDHGYLEVQVDSPKLVWSDNDKKVQLTYTVRENGIYRISSIQLAGDLVGKGEELKKLITLRSGDIASTEAVNENARIVGNRLGDLGYGLAVVHPDYHVDYKKQTADIRLVVMPGKRTVARRIEFRGNIKTRDEVLRREMRVQEGGTFSRDRLEESQRRLANLGYLENVTFDVSEVPGSDNQVDVTYRFKEVSSTGFNAQVGMTDYRGLVYGASLSDINFLGTGKYASISFDNSNSAQSYGVHYFDPYFTDDQLGFGLDATIDAYNPHRIDQDLSGYRRRVYGLTGRFSVPLSDYTSFYYGAGFERVKVPDRPTVNVNPKIEKFLDKYGDTYNNIKLIMGVNYNTLDRGIFPRQGLFCSANLEGYIPISHKDLGYYRGSVHGTYYHPIHGDWILKLNAEAAYGNGYGKTKELPFYRRYFAGGIGSIRGFETSTLSSLEDAHRIVGDNLLTVGSVALIIPSPYPESARISAFVDVGNVFDNYFKFSDLRASAGVQLELRTPIAPVVLSLAKPIRKKPWDQTDLFQFSISTSF